MTGKVINENPAAYLILILPVAATIIFLYEAWLYLLGLLMLIMAWRVWDNYQWQQWCVQMNPLFNQLIKDNQGCLTPMDLTLKGNLSGRAARRFLERKAEEYGAYRRKLQDQSIVYYFITASTLGSIFDTSEGFEDEAEVNRLPVSAAAAITVDTPVFAPPSLVNAPPVADTASIPPNASSHNALAHLAQIKEAQHQEALQQAELAAVEPEIVEAVAPIAEEASVSSAIVNEVVEEAIETQPESQPQVKLTLIQADLAKRLDTTSSTIARRKSDPDFPIWSQSKDPEGCSWQYLEEEKVFVTTS